MHVPHSDGMSQEDDGVSLFHTFQSREGNGPGDREQRRRNRLEEYLVGHDMAFQGDIYEGPDSLLLHPVLLASPVQAVGPLRWDRSVSLSQTVTTLWLAPRGIFWDFLPFVRRGSMLPPLLPLAILNADEMERRPGLACVHFEVVYQLRWMCAATLTTVLLPAEIQVNDLLHLLPEHLTIEVADLRVNCNNLQVPPWDLLQLEHGDKLRLRHVEEYG